jgi:Mn2+/Fe2+ NRAMP family transporter
VLLNVFGTSVITALILPPIVVGLVLMTSSRKYMVDSYKNRWWETGILVIIAVIGIWSTVEIIRNFVDQISKFI